MSDDAFIDHVLRDIVIAMQLPFDILGFEPESNFMNTPSVVERFNLQLLNPVKYNDWIKGAQAINEASGTFEDFMAWSRLDPTSVPDQDVAGMRIRWEGICARANAKVMPRKGVTFPGEYLLATLDVTKQFDWLKGAGNIYRAGGCFEDFLKWTRTDPNWKESEGAVQHARNAWATETAPKPEATKAHVPTTAQMLLGQARDVMDARAKEYDKPEGERSMAATVTAFNAVTKHDVSESEGWLFMSLLKMVRDRSTVAGHRDSCEDLVAYSSLYGEARLAELDKQMMSGAAQLAASMREPYSAVCKWDIRVMPAAVPSTVYLAENTSSVSRAAPATTDVDAAQRSRMLALVKLVRDQYGKAAARFVIHHFGGADKVMDTPVDKAPKVIEAITRLYPNIEQDNL